MAKYKKGASAKFSETVADEDEDYLDKISDLDIEKMPITCSIFSLDGLPLSALNKTILPKTMEFSEETFDIFGFKKERGIDETEDGCLFRIQSNVSENESTRRERWITHLEFTNETDDEVLKWGQVDIDTIKNTNFEELIKKDGIPHSLRPFLWMIISGGLKKRKSAIYKYKQVLNQCSKAGSISIDSQIEKDVLRTLPNHLCFLREDSVGVNSLRNLLKAIAFLYPDLGYCQGIGMVVANILLICPEEYTFWIMNSILDDILPSNYYAHSLIGLQTDQRVIQHLVNIHMPELSEALKKHDVDLSMVTANWLLTLFSSLFRPDFLFRIWDLFLTYGSPVLFRVIISMLKINEEEILMLINKDQTVLSIDIFNYLSKIPKRIHNIDHLLEICNSFDYAITPLVVKELREKISITFIGKDGFINQNTLQYINKKSVVSKTMVLKSKTFLQQMFTGTINDEGGNEKSKNIKQTEKMINLKNSIVRIVKHFEVFSENNCDSAMNCSSINYHFFKYEDEKLLFLNKRRKGRKRARALLNFHKRDTDELDFKKNSVITIINDKDDHCWIGELDGMRGWFPAHFVVLIDEIGKNYSTYGDEAINEEIGYIVRNQFISSIIAIFEHGLKDPFNCSAFLFVDKISQNFIARKSKMINSRLALCNTFKLDQDKKVLSPEELLFRAVQQINCTHTSPSTNRSIIKLRSLIIHGLNEQCLHLWFAILCDNVVHEEIRKKFYESTSFIQSPAWVQISCELKVLADLPFNLNYDYELAIHGSKNGSTSSKLSNKNNHMTNQKPSLNGKNVISVRQMNNTINEPLKEGVQDVLIKHQLFSWDL